MVIISLFGSHDCSSLLYIFFFRALDKLDLEVLDFWLFTLLSILEWFFTWFFRHARITVRALRIFKVKYLSDRVRGRFILHAILKLQ